MNELTEPVLLTILGCEVGFWVLVIGGLVLRYVIHAKRLSGYVLAAVPVLDVVLLVAVALDLHRGGEIGVAHRLAPIYLGVTIAFGRRLIAWADVRFAHWFDDGPKPEKIPKSGPARFRYEWQDFGRWLVAAGIAAAMILVLGFGVADAEQRTQLFAGFQTLGIITAIWLLTGPLWVSGSLRSLSKK
ncbi:hypothetical protein [Gordonia hydrophobica]|uniref:Integral membrane protein n=1 Tax=Gordonia hydrophobica TaxID=40516 RepID=A0ABZ2TYK0_9ACTN|nr:hypothetical protein [Gordonia hydrophobica]MBM7366416.1 hypothetical protein [Gordonia hydrophobica]